MTMRPSGNSVSRSLRSSTFAARRAISNVRRTATNLTGRLRLKPLISIP